MKSPQALLSRSLTSLLLLSSFISTTTASATSSESTPRKETYKPCVARSPTTGLYFDLNALSISQPVTKEGEKAHKGDRDESWHARGHDYHANFTINICAPVIENVRDVVGVEKARWKNVSAYYEMDGDVFSIGQQSSDPFFRGRRLILNYTDGSPCPGESKKKDKNEIRTKSTMMSFLCDRDAPASQAAISFVGTMDSCTYFFEVRSSAACGGIATNPNGEGLGPAGVFGVIALIAIAAYLIGGCAYQRTVMHQRGWRQCPNFSLWAGTWDFFKDLTIILFSSLARILRLDRSSRGGYARAGTSGESGSAGGATGGGVGGRRRGGGFIGAIGGRRAGGDAGRGSLSRVDVDAENRLIDQLDEEWDD